MPVVGQTLIPSNVGPPRDSVIPKFGGGQMPIRYEEVNFKRAYHDENTGEVLPTELIRAAIEDELE